MNQDLHSSCGLSGWWNAFSLGVSHWSTADAGSNHDLRFVCLNKIGEIGPARSTVSWNLELRLSEEFHDAHTRMLANGYAIQTTSSRGTQAQSLYGFIPSPGVFLLHGPSDLVAQLFCAEREISGEALEDVVGETEGESNDALLAQWISLGDDQQAHLSTRLVDDARIYCLQLTGSDEASARSRAESYLEVDVPSQIASELQRRKPFFDAHPHSRDNPTTLLAFETLISHLQPTTAPFRGRWIANSLVDEAFSGPSAPDSLTTTFPTNHLYAAVTTWNLIDLAVSKELVQAAISIQQNDGRIDALYNPQSPPEDFDACWPILAQCCREIWNAALEQDPSAPPDLAFFGDVLPRIDEHVQFSAEHFTLEGSEYHGWQTPEESLVPEIFDDKLVSIPLTSLLLCEIDELMFFAKALPSFSPERSVYNELRPRLVRNLSEGWNEKAHAYTDFYLNGDPVNRVSIGSYFPLRWPSVDPALATETEKQLKNNESLLTPDGVALWETWDTDDIHARVEALHQMFMPLVFGRTSLIDQQGAFSQGIQNAQQTWYKSGAGLPSELALERNEFGDLVAPPRQPFEQKLDAACLHLTSQVSAQAMDVNISDYPWIIRWLERNRQIFTTLVTLLFFAAVTATALYFSKAKQIGWRSEYTKQGLARNRYQIGQYDDAIKSYTELIGLSEKPSVKGDYQFMLGNAYFKTGEYEKAAEYYRASMESSGATVPQPQWNLTQCLYRLGEYEAARDNLTDWVEKFSEHYPNLEKRAEVVFSLIQSQIERTGRQDA